MAPWYCVGEEQKRDKVGQVLREHNSGKYKSSMKQKRLRWRKEKEEKQAVRDDDTVLNNMLKDHYEAVESKWQTLGKKCPDNQVLDLFTQHNISLLESLKSNAEIQRQINRLV